MIEVLNLVDIWRLKTQMLKDILGGKKTRYGFSQSRIHFFLILCHLEYYTETTQILPGIKSDHSLLKLSLLIKDEPKRGRGVWKLNVSLLQDKQFILLIKETIGNAIIDSRNLSDTVVWDFMKCQIHTEAISYSIIKSKESNNYLASMNAKLCILEEEISSTSTVEKVEEYNLTKIIIDNIFNEKAMGSIVHSRCKFIEEFEEPTKYFLSLEKANHHIKHIRSLIHNGKQISDPRDFRFTG